MAENLDLACARLGYKLSQTDDPKQLEKILRDAEAVLEERGPYALFLYLEAQKGAGTAVRDDCLSFMCEQKLVDGGKDWKDAVQELAQNLDSLLFARDLLRRAFIYGFEHVKART